ncbi:MAG: hypothetical protein JF591_13100 [Lysobacter sp.]|nr:hypothetical protein [Lysobacter sp.]
MAASKRDAARVERACAWGVVALVHAGFVWVAMQWRMPADAVGEDSALAVIFIAAPTLAPVQNSQPAQPPQRRDPVAAPAPSKPPPRARVYTTSASPSAVDSAPQEPPTGLTAVQIDPRPSDPRSSESTRATRAPWDAPTVDLLERRAPTLPGHATQRFKMQQPRSLAHAVERFGQLFGGRGEDPCKRTRANIDGLASQGDSADLQRELEYERRYCRP